MNIKPYNPHDLTYHKLLDHVLAHGDHTENRTGVKTLSTFGVQAKFRLQDGFPLLTTKKVFWKGVVEELLWFLRGETNARSLRSKGVNIWNAWSYEPDPTRGGRTKTLYEGEPEGEVGPVYGFLWRHWPGLSSRDLAKLQVEASAAGHALKAHDYGGVEEQLDRIQARLGLFGQNECTIDQLESVIQQIKTTPDSRRLIVTAWNPSDLSDQGLPPCHYSFQFSVRHGELSCLMNQRSADLLLGVPFNIASYALLTHLVAHVTNLKPGMLIMNFGDLHIYENHLEQVREQMSRSSFAPPMLELSPSITDIDDFTTEHIQLKNYQSHTALKAPVAV